jgi:hypothetical protein
VTFNFAFSRLFLTFAKTGSISGKDGTVTIKQWDPSAAAASPDSSARPSPNNIFVG